MVTLHWPPAPPAQLAGLGGYGASEQPEPLGDDAAPPATTLSNPRLIGGVAEITSMIAAQLDDGASTAEVMPVIRDTARR